MFNVFPYTSAPGGIAFWNPIWTNQPYAYDRSKGDLLIDLVAHDAGAGLNRATDAATPGGSIRSLGATGPTSVPDRLELIAAGNAAQGPFSGLVPGGAFKLAVQSTAKAYSGTLLASLFEPFFPIDLGPYQAPNNFLHLAQPVVVSQPFTLQPVGGGYLTSWLVQVGNYPRVPFYRFTAQAFVLDAAANGLGIVTTNAQRITIGEPLPHPSNQVEADDPNAASGTFAYPGGMPGGAVVRLDGSFQ
jgi:hypothetical protein